MDCEKKRSEDHMGNKILKVLDGEDVDGPPAPDRQVSRQDELDEVERPFGDINFQTAHPVMNDENNRPPVATDENQGFDEVDIPSAGLAPPVNISIDLGESGILDSIRPVPEKVPKNEEPESDEMLDTINNPYGKKEFKLEELFDDENDDNTDGRPTGISQTDGPPTQSTEAMETDAPVFASFFKTAPQQQVLVQHRSERRNKENIVTKHTTYHPKPLEKPNSGIPDASNLYSNSFYKMNFFPRGRLTIINVKHFKRSSGMADYPREGTNRDAEGLTNLFLDLGFVVDRFDNPSKKEIMAIVKAAAYDDYTNKGCSACAILSHGEEGIIYGIDEAVQIKDLTKLFRTRSLAGKPKFFLIQACQGSEYMDPLDQVDGLPGSGSARKMEEEMALALPSEADFLYAYSTVPGYYSWRNSRRGSWFMEALVKVFRESAHKMDVMRMLVQTNNIVSSRKSRTDDYKTDNKRQIASIVNQMRMDFFLFPPYGPLPIPM